MTDLYAQAKAKIAEERAARVSETCREEVAHERCGKPADFILWGKLLPKEAIGPRCWEHAVKHLGHAMPSRADQYAVYDLRPINDYGPLLDLADAVLERRASSTCHPTCMMPHDCLDCGEPSPCADARAVLAAVGIEVGTDG